MGKWTNKEYSEKSILEFLQFVKFGLVGVYNSIVNYVIYYVSLKIFRAVNVLVNSDIYVAQILAFVFSVLWAFVLNNKFVFAEKNRTTKYLLVSLLKKYAVYAFMGLVLSELLLDLRVNVIGISEYIAPIINILICLPLNFLLNKLWAFKK